MHVEGKLYNILYIQIGLSKNRKTASIMYILPQENVSAHPLLITKEQRIE